MTAIRELGLYKRLFRNSVDGLLYLLMMMMFNVISLLGIRKERTREIAQKVIHQSNSRLKSEGNFKLEFSKIQYFQFLLY